MTTDLTLPNVNTDSWQAVRDLQLPDIEFNRRSQKDLIMDAGPNEDLKVGNNRLKDPFVSLT